MTTDYRAELERIIDAHDADEGMSVSRWTANLADAINRARALLDQQEPEAPTYQEMQDLASHCVKGNKSIEWVIQTAIARWGHRTPQPNAQ